MYTGASGCTIEIRNGRVYKRGPASKIIDEVKAYSRLRRTLGIVLYADTFPWYSAEVRGERGVLVTDLVGEGKNLEWYLAEGKREIYGFPIEHFVERAIGLLWHHGLLSRTYRAEEGQLLLSEMFESLEDALQRKGDLSRQEWGHSIRAHPEMFGTILPSLCHRDMGLHNIVPMHSGSVRFIDPLLRLVGATTVSRGAAEYDLVRLIVNMSRMKFIYGWGCPPDLCSFLNDLLREQAAQAFIDLCFAVVYAQYAACSCEQCRTFPGLLHAMEAESERWLRAVESHLGESI